MLGQKRIHVVIVYVLLLGTLLAASGAKDVPSSKHKHKPKHKHGKKIHLPMSEKDLEHKFAPNKLVNSDSVNNKASKSGPYNPQGITFHGGGTIDSGVVVYIIWYGSWTNAQQNIITNFITSMDPSNTNVPNSVRNWWAVSSIYFNAKGNPLSSSVSLKGQFHDSYSYGSSLTGDDIANIAYDPMANGQLPFDPKGNYLVLTSNDVFVDGFCNKFCGYHNSFYLDNNPSVFYKYSFIGNAGTQCPRSCTALQNLNGDVGVDGMISVIGHEMIETVTDPKLDAWFSSSGDEAGDLCNFKFGSTFSTGNGQRYNLIGKNNVKYLAQQLFNPRTGSCVLTGTTGPTCS